MLASFCGPLPQRARRRSRPRINFAVPGEKFLEILRRENRGTKMTTFTAVRLKRQAVPEWLWRVCVTLFRGLILHQPLRSLLTVEHEHFWRPGVSSKGPVKHCDECNATVQISNEDFYALFGRLPRF